jgi:hypothetical protein
LETLCLLLEMGGPMLRPFLPQLQTTFVKSLHDPNDRVRNQGAVALSKVIYIIGLHGNWFYLDTRDCDSC